MFLLESDFPLDRCCNELLKVYFTVLVAVQAVYNACQVEMHRTEDLTHSLFEFMQTQKPVIRGVKLQKQVGQFSDLGVCQKHLCNE